MWTNTGSLPVKLGELAGLVSILTLQFHQLCKQSFSEQFYFEQRDKYVDYVTVM